MSAPLKFEALCWVRLGIPALPIIIYYDEEKEKWIKRPIVYKYTTWRDRPMTIEECEALPWNRADGIMLLTGLSYGPQIRIPRHLLIKFITLHG